ncbi:MAG: 16S rRNA (guanine(527)-N(7))-methyltransferase RsmG [Elusimicrobia bacterium RIFCSPLOWO2_01_FULL_59_12]|nr:MAG: 16S rRNA (guanine(527)-N(7))-methyltransferase RsmG [Elusimicrobia bacterium RIFCSPLOWO2_01_FULL_59_12]
MNLNASSQPGSLPGSQKDLLEKYVNAVLAAPASLGLTATRDPAEFWERHVLDALKLLTFLPKNLLDATLRVIDIGSGNGVPGIPIAIALPGWSVYLLDASNKKTGFLDMFCKSNKIENAIVLPGRAEILGHHPKFRGQFDLAFSRALGKLPTALELSVPFLKRDGLLIIPHGYTYQTELLRSQRALNELGAALQDSKPYSLNKIVNYTALTFLKINDTPETYPRKVGTPTKRPLLG